MILFPHAKINLGLYVTGKRPDGYHDIVSVLYPIPLYDVLEILPANSFQFNVSGLEVPGGSADNLALMAWDLMRKKFDLPPVYLHLLKNIPMGAGMGGGSSDAAFTIKGLNNLFKLKLSVDQMKELAAELGSDCPFFIEDSPQLAKGRGELLSKFELNLSGYYIKLVNSSVHISSGEAYKHVNISKSTEEDLKNVLNDPMSNWKNTLFNSFERTVFHIYPELNNEKESLYREGAIYAGMTGSGSTVYGLFKSEPLCANVDQIVLKL